MGYATIRGLLGSPALVWKEDRLLLKGTQQKNKPRKRRLIFRAWSRSPSGEILYARDYGYRAWPMYV